MSPRPTRRQYARAGLAAVLGGLTAVAIAPAFGRGSLDVFADLGFTLSVVGAIALAACVPVLVAAGTRLAPVMRLALTLAMLAGYVVLVVAPGGAVASGPKRLVTSALPLEPAGPELAVVVVLVGLATVGAVEPALRRRAALLVVPAPLVGLTVGLAVSASAAPPARWLAVLFVLTVGLSLAIARGDRPAAVTVDAARVPPVRQLVAAVVVAAVLVGLGAASVVGPAALAGYGSPRAADARELVPQPVRPRQDTSPLSQFPALRTGKLTFAVSGFVESAPGVGGTDKDPPSRLRYATLESFDGEHWTTRASYRRAGTRLPMVDYDVPVVLRRERIRIDRPGPLGWLLSSGRPVAVSEPGLGVDERSGDVVLPADRRQPTEYTVDSVQPAYGEAELLAATPETGPPGDAVVLSPALSAKAMPLMPKGLYGYEALRALADRFRDGGDFRVDETSKPPAGHGLYHINQLLDTKRGTAEQYASAYAVFVRTQGYRARVVVGFLPHRGRGDSGAFHVTGQGVHAWVEVAFHGLGWVAFDPTPQRPADESATGESAPKAEPSTSPPTPPDATNHPAAAAPERRAGPARSAARQAATVGAWAGAGLLVAVVAWWCAVPAAKSAQRRRRRRLVDPKRRALGAWRDALDGLREAGLRPAAYDTSGDLVVASEQRFGAGLAVDMHRLARLHDAAAFAPGALTGSAADAAWLHATSVRRLARATLSPLGRLRAAVSPAPLWRRRRATRRGPAGGKGTMGG